MNAEQIAKALGGRKSGSGYIARCVAHAESVCQSPPVHLGV